MKRMIPLLFALLLILCSMSFAAFAADAAPALEVLVEPTKEAEGFGKYTWNVAEYGEFTFEAAISNVVLGDVNEDDKVTILDLMRLANFFAGKAQLG